MVQKMEIPGRRGVLREIPSVVGVWIFSGTTHCTLRNEMKSALCEMKICTLRNEICTLRNENLYFAK